MILTGNEIRNQQEFGNIFIQDFDEKRLGPNSYNLRLAPELLIYNEAILDAREPNRTEKLVIPEEGMILYPGKLYLARTMERTKTMTYVPMLEGRSSIGRLGMHIHVTAGFGDLGFDGNWTLEIHVIHPVRVYPGMEICQIYFLRPDGAINMLYQGKYQGQTDVVASRMFMDWRDRNGD